MAIKNLAGLRDEVRRLIYVIPAIDLSIGASGQPGPSQPNPINAFINDSINHGVSFVNRKARLAPVITATKSALGQPNARGPFFMDLSSQLSTLQVAEVRVVEWTDAGTGVITVLQPINWYGVDYATQPFLQDAPVSGGPQAFFVQGYEVAVIPPPLADGTLTLTAGTSLPHYSNDSDSISTIPEEYQVAWVYYAASEQSAAQTMDLEAADRVKPYMEMAMDVVEDIKAWRDGFRLLYQPASQGGARQAPSS